MTDALQIDSKWIADGWITDFKNSFSLIAIFTILSVGIFATFVYVITMGVGI